MSIEETIGYIGQEEEAAILKKHQKSGKCDPNKKKKPMCPVKRCKEILTFSNTSTCKTCSIKVCLKHRFPADHDCGRVTSSSLSSAGAGANGQWKNRFLAALASRNGQDCGKSKGHNSSSASNPSVKAY
ncbi:hypothetical protein TanjilG_04081 [Lupinus angustifolius]|uniref:AN1-type domain-containing protein n=2 Tax=Lupinus angustifolius TaxID=3871 RepID=A0A394C732_LUPAN|nr:hypothetical protein TanjilG_04079 [Lupinus angustifolius]OIW06687.1 hypothetical protein TanjilG_04081 [Lupinus angustifolius]